MPAAAVQCPQCHQPLPGLTAADLAILKACPACAQVLEILPLPAWGRGPAVGQTAADRVTDADAACYFHPSKRAEVPCDRCGRFLCALCRLELDGQNLCPTCVTTAAGSGGLKTFEKQRFRWDLLVWMLTIGPLITLCFWWLTPVTCLAAVILGIWKLNSPPSRIHRSRTRLIAGAILALLLLLASAALMLFLTVQSD